jgi:hypothetical protein
MPKFAVGQREIPMSPVVLNTLRPMELQCPRGKLDLTFRTLADNMQALSDVAATVCRRKQGWSTQQASRASTLAGGILVVA